jgi:hypothetical protein
MPKPQAQDVMESWVSSHVKARCVVRDDLDKTNKEGELVTEHSARALGQSTRPEHSARDAEYHVQRIMQNVVLQL